MDLRIPARTALVALLATAGGCALIKPEATDEVKTAREAKRDESVAQATALLANGNGASGGPRGSTKITPKRCELTSIILKRPLDDPLLTQTLWQTVDEQGIPAETRRLLTANGIRAGVLSGGLPPEISKLLQEDTPITERGAKTEMNVPDGSHYLVQAGEAVPSASLLVNLGDRVMGKEYSDAKGMFRLTASQNGQGGVSLKFLPEIHHGPVRNAFNAAPNLSPYEPQQFVAMSGQEEASLRELTIPISLEPGQIAVLGSVADRDQTVGDFFFIRTEANSDRLTRSVVLVSGKSSNSDAFGHAMPEVAKSAAAGSGAEPSAFPLLKNLKLGRDRDKDEGSENDAPKPEPPAVPKAG